MFTSLDQVSMVGKKCIVSGANAGIGFYTALTLAQWGADIALICRDPKKGQVALEHIQSRSPGRHQLFLADLSDLEQVKRVGKEVSEAYEYIHVLVNNAGGHFPRRMESAQGYEMTFALNHLGYFMLTHCLLPTLMHTPASRIVNVASRAHRTHLLDLNDLQFTKRPYLAFFVYGTSKLLNIFFTQALSKRLQNQADMLNLAHIPTVNCLHPGVVNTEFGQDYSGWFNRLMKVGKIFLTPPQKGAETSIFLASSPQVEGLSGGYYSRCKLTKPRSITFNQEIEDRLWTLSEDLCGVQFGVYNDP